MEGRQKGASWWEQQKQKQTKKTPQSPTIIHQYTREAEYERTWVLTHECTRLLPQQAFCELHATAGWWLLLLLLLLLLHHGRGGGRGWVVDEQVPAVVSGPLALALSIHLYPSPPVQDGSGEHSALGPCQAGSLVLKLAWGMLGAKDVAQAHGCGEREEHGNHGVMMLLNIVMRDRETVTEWEKEREKTTIEK